MNIFQLYIHEQHRNQFKNVEERDKFLNLEIRALVRKVEEIERQIDDIKRSQEEEQQEEEQLNTQIRVVHITFINHPKVIIGTRYCAS